MRADLFGTPEHQYLLMVWHHIAFDGWSSDIFFNDLAEAFAGHSLMPTEIDYADYAYWHRQRFSGQRAEPLRDFWRGQLSGLSPLNLHPDFPRPAHFDYRGADWHIQLAPALSNKLRQLAREQETTLYTLMLSAFYLTLATTSGQQDIVVGTPSANRHHSQTQSLIGYFVNPLVLRHCIDSDQSVVELIAAVQQTLLAAKSHQDLPFEQVVELLDLPQDLSTHPVFQVVFGLQDFALDHTAQSKLPFKSLPSTLDGILNSPAKFDLSLFVNDSDTQIRGVFNYATSLFCRSTIQQMAELYVHLLTVMVESPRLTLNQLPLMPQQRLPAFLPETKQYDDANQTIGLHQQFEQQVFNHPNAVALTFEGQTWHYQVLNRQANKLAHALLAKGLTSGDRVPLYQSRGSNLIIAMLAVLKAGGCYVPLCPTLPEARVEFILSDINACWLIADDKALPPFIADNPSITVLNFEQQAWTQQPADNPALPCAPDDLAYVIYTSGTTGKPKGVLTPHRAVISLVNSDFIDVNRDDVFCHLSNPNFDAATFEIWQPLCVGAAIKVAPQAQDLAADAVEQMLDSVTTLWLTSALFDSLFAQKPTLFATLKTLIVGGEALTPANIQQLMASEHRPEHLLNGYGPTETTTFATVYECGAFTDSVPIGKAIGGRQLYVLDGQGRPVPPGCPGELFIGGRALALGYLNRPNLTAQRFVQNPFEPDGRLYKTGDIVKWRHDGQLIYLGRNDQQIKIRGYRIEPGEIESLLAQCPGVDLGVVAAVNNGQHKQLVAYVVGNSAPEALKSSLKSSLPGYMQPDAIVKLDAIPMTHNGKVDYHALPAPRLEAHRTIVPLRDGMQRKIADVWREVLGVEDIGAECDFFALGGNSIVAIRLICLLNLAFDSQLAVKHLFSHRTINALSGIIAETQGEFKYRDFLLQPGVQSQQTFALTNVQQAYLYGRMDGFEMGNVSAHGYSEYLYETVDPSRLEGAINILIARHPALRTVFIDNGQRTLEPAPHFCVIDHGDIDQASLIAIRKRLSHKLYDTSRFALFDFEISRFEGRTIVHFSFDALIMDGSSGALFFAELASIYNGHSLESLPPLAITFADYIHQYQRLRDSDLFNQAEAYWTERLQQYDFSAQLPLCANPATVTQPVFARKSTTIDKTVWRKVVDKAHRHHVSPTSVLLYIYGLVLCKYSGASQFCINLTLFNRLPLHPQVNDIVGDFTVLELFNFQRNEGPVLTGLANVHEQLWEDIEHNLFDGIDLQRKIRKDNNMSPQQVISPVVLTSVLGHKHSETLPLQGFIEEGQSITQTSQVYLDNKAIETEHGLLAEWDYVAQLFSPQTIDDMHALYCTLITKLGELHWDRAPLSLETGNHDQAVIRSANNATYPYERLTITDLCHRAAEVHAERTAVIDDQGSYNYQQVEQWYCRVAHKLVQSNAQPNTLVGVLSEKGVGQLVATLGIMNASAAYLPLHVEWPLGRIQEVLQQGMVKTVLVSRQQYEQQIQSSYIADQFEWLILQDIIEDSQWPTTPQDLPRNSLDDICYVIFTSGSTGKPKGVTLAHDGVVNTLLTINKRFDVGPTDSVLALSELSFDLSVYDLFGVFAAGGTIIFPAQNDSKNPAKWAELVDRHQISLWNTVPQLMQLLTDQAADLASLKAVMMSGDWIPVSLPEQIRRKAEHATIMSLGGATEGSIWSIWYGIGEVDPAWNSIPYGQAMDNQKMYVLDETGQHCPVGVQGEIHIGGVGVAVGYWQDKAKTDAAFFHHPTLGKLYRTGDNGKWHRNGYITFEGRKDNQVKLNGYRVELEEIGAKLSAVKGIESAHITLQQDALVAYLVSDKFAAKKPNLFDSFKTPATGLA